ncbi:MAG TPA: response regulator [Methylomirabilota bacterium]|nr:response regulator [Methylomirabilota bacterium]
MPPARVMVRYGCGKRNLVETILVVDDDPWVLGLARDVLAGEGYRILDATSGEAALRIAAGHAGPIHLLLTDVVMPGMGAKELADRLRPGRPELKVVYMSAYTAEVMGQHGVIETDVPFIAKPFTPDFLIRKIREVLQPRPAYRRPDPR